MLTLVRAHASLDEANVAVTEHTLPDRLKPFDLAQ